MKGLLEFTRMTGDLVKDTLAIEFVLLFVLAAGLAVLFAGLQTTLDERIRQGALLRALGPSGACWCAPGVLNLACLAPPAACLQPWLRIDQRPALSCNWSSTWRAPSWLLLLPCSAPCWSVAPARWAPAAP